MKRLVAAALAFAALAVGAGAASYDDFAQAVTANIRGDAEGAIKGFTTALKAGDLPPAYVFAAYRSRADAYLDLDRCSDALTDLNAAAALRPLDRVAYYMRASARLCVNDTAGAQQDFEAGNGLFGTHERFFDFARQQWQYGDFQNARGNLDKAIDMLIAAKDRDAHARYVVLWYAIAADRLGTLDRAKLEKAVDFLSSSEWPMPLLDFYLGTRKVEEVVAKAARGDSDEIPGQKCEADFYLAEWNIARGGKDAAKPLIASALAGCPAGFIELRAAKGEAKRLGVKEDKK
jgi:lipoprotein NlpI